MASLGINWNLLLAQLVNLVLIAGWLVLTGLALTRMRRCDLPETARTVWTALIVLVPFVGAIAFLMLHPGGKTAQ